MGKGTRNRQIHAEDKVTNPQKYEKKKQAPKWLSTVITVAIAVVLVVSILGSALSSNGVFQRCRTAMETDNYEVNGAMMSYFAHNYLNNLASYYENYDSTYQYIKQIYANNGSSSYSVYDYMRIDTSVSLKKQVKDEETGETWFDYIIAQTKDSVERQLIYCEAAQKAGMKLDEADLNEIESSINMLKIYAQLYGYTTSAYISNMYGKGVKEKDVRNAMKISALANKYSTKQSEDFHTVATKEDVEKFYNDNKNDYNTVDYLSYTFTATKETLGTDATDNEKAAAAAVYADAKKAISEACETLLAKTTADDFKAFVRDYWMNENKASYQTKYYEDYLSKAEGDNDDAKAEAAQKLVDDKLAEDADAKVKAMLVEKYAYDEEADLSKWAFDEKSDRALTHKEEDTSKDADGTYKATVYFLVREPGRDEELTRNVTYIMLDAKNYDEAKATEAFNAFKSGKADKDALLALGNQYTNYTSCTSVEDMKKGAFGLTEVDEWLYADGRKAGDYDMIKSTYTSSSSTTTYYVILLVDGIGDAAWSVDAENDLVSKKVEDWYEEAAKTYAVDINLSAINKIKM